MLRGCNTTAGTGVGHEKGRLGSPPAGLIVSVFTVSTS